LTFLFELSLLARYLTQTYFDNPLRHAWTSRCNFGLCR
jgi:hypothetical protein